MLYYPTGTTDFGCWFAMSQSVAASFLADAHVFNRHDYAVAVGKAPDDPAVEAMLSRHVRCREITHFAEGVFGTVPKGSKEIAIYPVSPYLVAPKLRIGAVLAYHSALDIHGHAYHLTHCVVHAFSPAGHEELSIRGQSYYFLEPPPGIVLGEDEPADGIEIVTHLGVGLRVTTIERTMADLFDRPIMGGDGFIESIEFISDLDGSALARHIRALGNAAAAGAMGFWLESRRDEHRVDDAALDELRALAPRKPMYALGAKPSDRSSDNELVGGWNVILPKSFVDPEIHGCPF